MTQQVLYLTATGQILQWQDTAAFGYPADPAGTATLQVSAAEWATQATPQHVAAGALAPGLITPALTLAQQAQALLAGGLTITSTGTPALDGTYAADPDTIGYVNSEVASIALNGTFADGTTSIDWPDASGVLRGFTLAEFKLLAAALGVFVSGIRKCVIGVSGASLPAAAATIA